MSARDPARSARALSPGLAARWKQAVKRAVDGIGCNDAAALAGLSPGSVSRMASGHHPDQMPMAAALMLADSSDVAARVFAELFADMAGFRLAARRGEDEEAPCRRAALAAVLTEAAEIVAVIAAAQADGEITPREWQEILRALGDFSAVSADLDRAGTAALSRSRT